MKLPVRIILAILSAALLTFSFVPLGHHLVVWVALVPLLLGIEGASHRVAFRLGFLCGMLFYGASLHWFWQIFGPMAAALWAVLAFYIGAFCGLYVWLANGRRVGVKCLLASALWVSLEYFRSECYYLKFTWFGLGYSQVTNFFVLQLASVLGAYGISFLIVAVNVLVSEGIRLRLRGRQFVAPLAFLSFVLPWMFIRGVDCLRRYEHHDFAAAAIQTDLVGLDRYVRLTEQIKQDAPRLVVWPEFSISEGMSPEADRTKKIVAFAKRMNAVLVVGGKGKHSNPKKWYSSAFVVSPDKGVIGEYRKNVPVQFHADGESGGEFPAIESEAGKLGIAICYDATYPYVVRRIVANGAELLAVPSYDMPFWGSVQWRQHSWLIPMRAVENRRWVVRSTSFGITHIIDPAGRTTHRCPLEEPAVVAGNVGRVQHLSHYTRWGWMLPHVCVALLLLAASIKTATRRTRRATAESEAQPMGTATDR